MARKQSTNVMKMPGLLLYEETLESLQDCTDQEFREIITAMWKYKNDVVEPNFSDRFLKNVFCWAKEKIDLQRVQYTEKCIKNAYNQAVRWAKERNEVLDFREWFENDFIPKHEELRTSEYVRILANTGEIGRIATETINENGNNKHETKTVNGKQKKEATSESDKQKRETDCQGEVRNFSGDNPAEQLSLLKEQLRHAKKTDNATLEIALKREIKSIEERLALNADA